MLRRFLRRSRLEQRTLVHAVVLYGAVAGALKGVRYGRLIRTVDRLYRPGRGPADPHVAQIAIWAASTAAMLLPVRNQCLVAAIVGRCLLRRAGVVTEICFGADRAARPPTFHAWLAAGDTILIGADSRFVPLAGSPSS